jgi:NAD(P)-dependent dehydrogenase (short-subunit alcohol dehydrogenase family)
MTTRDLSGTTAIVTGASRGFGRATAATLAGRGAHVIGVARTERLLHELRVELGTAFTPEPADVTDPQLAQRLIAEYRPQTLVLNAGATPTPGPLFEQSWEAFSENWHVDVKHVFYFLQAALNGPLDPGSVVVSVSSGAALRGSPLSGGYAGAKSAIMHISSYAAQQAQSARTGVRFVAVLPQLSPATGLGRIYTNAYADQSAITAEQLVQGMGGLLSTGLAATGIADLATDDTYDAPAYLLTAHGLRPAV